MKKVIIRKTEEIENWRRNINSEINFIPTMGNLHNGHIKLISTAKKDNSRKLPEKSEKKYRKNTGK